MEKEAKDLSRPTVCYSIDTTAEQNIKDFFELWDMEYNPVGVYPDEDIVELYLDGNCDMYGIDRSRNCQETEQSIQNQINT